MSSNPPSGGFGRSFEEAMDRIESELREAVAYVNDAVVPQVRRESIAAMRNAAEMLRSLADRIEAAGRPVNPPSSPGPGSREPERQEKDPRV